MITQICGNWTTKICSFQPLCRLIVRIDQGFRPGSHDQIAVWIGFNRFSSKSHRFHFSYAVPPLQRFLNLFSLAMKKQGFVAIGGFDWCHTRSVQLHDMECGAKCIGFIYTSPLEQGGFTSTKQSGVKTDCLSFVYLHHTPNPGCDESCKV